MIVTETFQVLKKKTLSLKYITAQEAVGGQLCRNHCLYEYNPHACTDLVSKWRKATPEIAEFKVYDNRLQALCHTVCLLVFTIQLHHWKTFRKIWQHSKKTIMIHFVKTQKWIYSFVKQQGTDSQDRSYLLELLFLLLSLYIWCPSSTPSSTPTCFKWVHLNSFPTGCYLAINRVKVDMMEDVIFIHMTWQFLVWFGQVIIHTTTTWRGKIWMFQPFMYYF